MRSSPRLNRGTSVIAALVFAALLGGVVLGMHALQGNSTNPAALPAAAVVGSEVHPTCQEVLSAAVANHQSTPARTPKVPDSSQSTIDDSCNGAIAVTGIPPKGAQIETDSSGSQPVTYECVGMSGSINLDKNSVTLDLTPNSGVEAGKCQISTCSSGVCSTTAYSASGISGNGYGGGDTTSSIATSSYSADSYGGGAFAGTGANTGGLVPGEDIPSNCSASGGGSTITCTYSSSEQAAELQSPNGYTCTYNSSNQITTCNSDQSNTNAPAASCPTGQTGTPPNCVSAPPPSGCTGSNCTPSGSGNNNNGNGNGNSGSALSSLAQGLAKGLAQSLSPCSSSAQSAYVGGNGTGVQQVLVPNGQGGYTTAYVQQPTTAASSPCGSSAPYGVGNNGVACSAPPAVPSCTSGQTPAPISATGNGCITSYQCVNASTFGSQSTAQLSCSPQIADVGQSVAISYSCSNATGSTGSGFSTGNQTSGSASTTVATPPSGTNTATYGLTCTGGSQNASAQCSVQVNTPSIVLVANPQTVQSGATASIGWVTSGMQSCVISSPTDPTFTSNNINDTSVNGSAQTDAITGSTEFDLTCQTLGGETETASTVVSTGSATSATASNDITVNSTADGGTANHGGTITITWSDSMSNSNAAVSLWLIDLQTEQATALIAAAQSTSGSYQWQIPAVGSTCNSNSYAPCASNLVAGDSYGIEAALYTPQNAYLGPSASAPSGAIQPTYTDYGYSPEPFEIGQ